MQLESVRLFHLAASLGSISKAAAEAHISQPALSQMIQRLEKELGFALIERSSKGISLTEAGRVLARYAENFTGLYDNLIQDLSSLQSHHVTVRIAASPVIGLYGLPCTMFQVKSQFPDADFSMVTCPSQEAEQRVVQGASDIGFRIGPPTDGDLITRQLYSDTMHLVASSDFVGEESIDMAKFSRCPLVVQSNKSSLYNQIRQYFTGHGYNWENFNILFELDSVESVKSSVLQGHGMAFLPYLAIKKELYLKQLRTIQLKSFDMQYDVHIVYKKKTGNVDAVYKIASYFSRIGADTFC